MNKPIGNAWVGGAALLLAAASAPARKAAARARKRVAAHARVQAIQEALNKADGVMDDEETCAALKKFQSVHGLKATGTADKTTLKALGVG